MCGIAGFFGIAESFTSESLQLLANSLKHRGPDAQGFFQEKLCGLAHTRLSILDLSDAGKQPMISQNQRWAVAYNGEVYNAMPLKMGLKNVLWKSHTDTEVILEGWAKIGETFLQQLNGMFAIALYDRQEETLFLMRDRLGIKPLFIYHDARGRTAFASEIKALRQYQDLDWQLDPEAVSLFLHLGYIPAPYTIFKNVRQLKPAHIAKITKKGYQTYPFWQLPAPTFSLKDVTQTQETLHTLLRQAVKQRLVADVPVGIFLSGGVDSSLITALATEVSGQQVKTFSIGFEEKNFDETPYARKVAETLGTKHHEEILSPKEALNLLPEVIRIFDMPFADVSALPTLLLAKITRPHVTVALGGDGADELFWGYGVYQWAKRLALLRHGRILWERALGLRNSDAFRKGKNILSFSEKYNLPAHLFSQEHGFFSSQEIEELLITPASIPMLSSLKRFQYPIAEGEQAFFDLQYYLPDDLLVKIDRTTMYYALEARVPFLDHQVVAFAQQIASNGKYAQGESKVLLKKILGQYLPPEMFKRAKQGFGIPLAEWLQTPLKDWVEQVLTPQKVLEVGWLKPEKVQNLKRLFFEGDNFLAKKIWTLVLLHQFLQENNL